MLDSPVDEIKSRLDLIDIISEYFPMKQAGANYKALCPFHKEKSPSFMASKEKQIWHCFGCGEGGDLFGFVMKMEGLEFPDALKLLAAKAGVKLKRQDPQLQSKKNALYDICDLSARFFHELLLKHPKAQIARDYIKKRGLKVDTVAGWQIGYSPDSWDVLLNFLKQKGFSESDIFAAGMAVKKEGDGQTAQQGMGLARYYDRFRNRLMFPIKDVHGNVVGFTARVLDETRDKMGKYINTPQTAIYDKGRLLYGLDKAKTQIRKQNLAVLVEGNMDCISSHEAGVSNVVASSGTALTLDQVALLKRFSENIALAFDADLAGENASLRGIEIALQQGLNIKVITIPEGKDPDDCIRNNPQDWIEAIKNAVSIMDYYFARTLNGLDMTKAENKKGAAKFLLSRISRLPDRIEQAHYLQKLSSAINVSESVLREALPKSSQGGAPGAARTTVGALAQSAASAPVKIDRQKQLSDLFLALLQSTKRDEAIEKIDEEEMAPGPGLDLYKNLKKYYSQNNQTSIDQGVFWQNWQQNLTDKTLIDYNNQLSLFLDKEFDPGTNLAKELDKIILELKRFYLARQSQQISGELRQAESSGNKEKISSLTLKFNQISRELSSLN